jgi:hypothetical protein
MRRPPAPADLGIALGTGTHAAIEASYPVTTGAPWAFRRFVVSPGLRLGRVLDSLFYQSPALGRDSDRRRRTMSTTTLREASDQPPATFFLDLTADLSPTAGSASTSARRRHGSTLGSPPRPLI